MPLILAPPQATQIE